MLNFVRPVNFKNRLIAGALAFAISTGAALASDKEDVDAVLAKAAPPSGVVFEIVSGDERALDAALPRTREFMRKLRERFPDLPIAIVSHGSEQFALTNDASSRFESIHAFAKSLRSDDAVTVEVCGNHAAMRGVSNDSFPDYVKVVPRAPGAIDDYVANGYLLIIVD